MKIKFYINSPRNCTFKYEDEFDTEDYGFSDDDLLDLPTDEVEKIINDIAFEILLNEYATVCTEFNLDNL